MSDVDTKIRDYLTRVQPGWDREGVLGPALDAVLSACSSVERRGGAQLSIVEIRTRIADTAGIRTETDIAPISEPCNYCGAQIIWLDTATSRMPVDERPSDRGNIVIHRAGSKRVAVVLGAGKAAAVRGGGEPLYLHHNQSCGAAGKWSRGAGRG